jgi:hypothetical protein
MSNLTYILGFLTVLILLFSPGGFIGGSLQMMLVIALAVSIIKDARKGTD